jgi:16S rRNA (guanine(966)-N(2))-methyltransferase RsmD
MRITGGKYNRRKLIVPPGVIRPAMDRMRESLFAVLGDIRGCSFLDLYCGSGSVGIEAASRGADPVVFVEKDRGKRPTLERNLLFVQETTEMHFVPVEHFLRRVKNGFDRIFLDPPFRQRGKLEVLQLIATRGTPNPPAGSCTYTTGVCTEDPCCCFTGESKLSFWASSSRKTSRSGGTARSWAIAMLARLRSIAVIRAGL